MDPLRLQLQQLREFSYPDGSIRTLPFVPETNLRELLTREALNDALLSSSFHLEPHQREYVVSEVRDGALKIFAILVELRIEGQLKTCLEKCLTDSALPILDPKRLEEIFPESVSHFQKLQYEYVPLKFREFSHKYLENNLILPYIENIEIASGAFSKVFKSTVHPFYQDWEPSNRTTVRPRFDRWSSY